MSDKNNKYITLKEAAKISGYAPDYIGQLIRKGKLPGKQIFSNIAWVTSEKALREYLKKPQKENSTFNNKLFDFLLHYKTEIIHKFRLVWLLRTALYSTVIFLVLFSLLLFYIFSVNLEKRLGERALQKIIQKNGQISK